jgi:hypothetical protein
MIKETRIPSFGEQLIGIDIDSPETDEVTKVKKLFAEVAEIMKKNYTNNSKHPVKSLLFDHAVGEITNAEMSVVKVLTLKHYTEDETSGTQGAD